MKRSGAIPLILLSVLSLSAVVTASASALKGEIVNTSGGALKANHFTAIGGETTIETVAGAHITCLSSKGKGVVTSTTAGEKTTTFAKCASTEGQCTTTGDKTAGEMTLAVTWKILATLPDNLLINSVLSLSTFTCGESKGSLKGGYAVPVEPLEKLQTEYTLTASETKGIQEPSEKEDTLQATIGKAGKEEPAAVKGKDTITFEEPAEFR